MMKDKKLTRTLLAFLALVIAGASAVAVLGGRGSKQSPGAGGEKLKPVAAKKIALPQFPGPAQPVVTGMHPDGDRAGKIDEVRKARMHPTPGSIRMLRSLIDTDKDTAVLSEAMNTLGILAQRGIDTEKTFTLLSRKALDKDFLSRGEALLISAMIGKDRALPVLSTIIRGGGGVDSQESAMLGWASRSLNMIASPASVPLIEKLISQTTSLDVRGPSYDALSRAGTPEAFSFLKQQAQTTTGKDQAFSVAALSRSKDPETGKWIEGAMEGGALSHEAIATLAMMPAAPELFGKVLTAGGLSPEKQLEMLKLIAPALQGNPNLQKLAMAVAPLVYSGDAKVQEEAIELVGKAGGKEVSAIIQPLLSSEDPAVRRDAFYSYLKFTSADDYKYLFDFLNDKNPETRRMAMFILGKFYGSSDRSALEQAAQSSDTFIRDRAKQYLSSLN